MKPIRLIELFRHISERTLCPNCKARIDASSIEIDASTEHSALLTMHCPACRKDLHAHVVLNIADPETISETEDIPKTSADEVSAAHNFLEGFNGNFSLLFPDQK